MNQRLLGSLLLGFVACADANTATTEQQAAAAPADSDRWYANSNTVTIYAPAADATHPAMSADHWLRVWEAMQIYNSDTAVRMVAGCASQVPPPDATHPPTCAIPTDNRAHLLVVDKDSGGGRTWKLAKLKEELDTNAEAPPFKPWIPLMRSASQNGQHDDFIIGFGRSETLTKGGVAHEMGHALGLIHEQQRTDAAANIYIYDCCLRVPHEYAPMPSQEALSPYDLMSMMQYPSFFNDSDSCYEMLGRYIDGFTDVLPHTSASCQPRPSVDMTYQPQWGYVIPPSTTPMSAEDRNVLYQMYPPLLGSDDPGDDYAHALASGDFNNDGYTDLAVGASGDGATGAVFLYRGTFTGLVPWRRFSGQDGSTDSQFGAAVAMADLDGDKMDDLIVGAPNAPVGGVHAAGKIWVFHGSSSNPDTTQGIAFTIANMGTGALPQPDDRFGSVLAAASFNGDGRDELAVGVPNRHRAYVVSTTGTWPSLGLAHYADYGGSQNHNFGAALATGDLDGDNVADLAIGGSFTDTFGRVILVHGSPSGGFGPVTSIPNPTGNADQFGAAIAIVNMGTSVKRLVVGAPATNNNQGRIVVFSASGSNPVNIFGGGWGVDLTSAQFGFSLAVGDTDSTGTDHLAVGAPGANGGAGIVGLFFANSSQNFVRGNFFGRWDGDVPNSHYGKALAAGNFDGRGPVDFAVGEPGLNSNAGELWIIHGRTGQMMDYHADNPNAASTDSFSTWNTTQLQPSSLPRR